ncbi:winged helix-turn-helix transcriptional regulator [Soonwooa sp.]|uniref:winged helix-turn-helix transcriptional regulator n=1 Tax=Soonwooa sp. TaxID=1938592 RepID=UPI00260F5FDE|nr:winged helix-turn-helix transcriptional regulator [Soonwooa sp.]
MSKQNLEITDHCLELMKGLKDTQDLLRGKWKVVIIQTLNYGHVLNFGELKYYITNISAKVLTQELKDLEQNLLIKREETTSKPMTVNYSLSELGKSLFEILQLMSHWGVEYRKTVFKKEDD